LPDAIAITQLESRGDVFRTDRDYTTCASDNSKIGPDADDKAGGCDNIRMTLNNSINTRYIHLSD